MTAEPLPAPAPEQTERDPAPGRGRALLALVPSPVRARRAPFVVLLIGLLAGGLIGLLLLNTASAQDSFRLHDLQTQAADLQKQLEVYSSSDDGLDDPGVLYVKAALLGMQPGGIPTFLAPGQPIPAGAVRVGPTMVYIPGPKPVPAPSAVVTPPPVTPTAPAVQPTATARNPAAAQPTTKPTTNPTAKTGKPATGTTAKTPTGTASKPAVGAAKQPTGTAKQPAKAPSAKSTPVPRATQPAVR